MAACIVANSPVLYRIVKDSRRRCNSSISRSDSTPRENMVGPRASYFFSTNNRRDQGVMESGVSFGSVEEEVVVVRGVGEMVERGGSPQGDAAV